MPATIHSIFLCPRCEEGITSIASVTSCPNCGLPLGKQELEPYNPPYTLAEQHEKYLDTKRLVQVVSELPVAKCNSIVNDALLILENIAGKKTRVEDIRQMVKMGVRIGEIAQAYEKFLEAGGKHFPGFFISEQQQNQEIQNVQPENRVVQDATTTPRPDGGRIAEALPTLRDGDF